ncbi:hypothetical protein DIPPA_20066 [Diplonema papillatum]|nr:hypothetical protein DIPPA_20066 [Diplonema papillatum]
MKRVARIAPRLRAVGVRWGSTASYENYLRLLQTQVVNEGVGMIEGEVGDARAKETKFVSINQLLAAPQAPKDPVTRFRDVDNIRLLAEKAGAQITVSDTDCSTMLLDLLDEVKRGRRLTKDILAIFERMETSPEFYRVEKKAYNLMIYNTVARDYPSVSPSAQLFGNMLEKQGQASPMTYILLARVQMFLPPVDRHSFRNAFLAEVDSHEDSMTPFQSKTTRFVLKRLKWITDGTRLLLYLTGVILMVLGLQAAIAYREAGREYRDVLEREMMGIMDERYFGDGTQSPGGRATDVIAGRAGLRVRDVEN